MPKARRFAHRRSRRARSNLAFHLAARSRSAFSMVSSSKLHGAWLLRFQDLKRTAECRSDCRKTEIWAQRKSSEAGESHSDEAFPGTLEPRPIVRFGVPLPFRELQSPSVFRGDSRKSARGMPIHQTHVSRTPISQTSHVRRLCSTTLGESPYEARTKLLVFLAGVLHPTKRGQNVAAAWAAIQLRHL